MLKPRSNFQRAVDPQYNSQNTLKSAAKAGTTYDKIDLVVGVTMVAVEEVTAEEGSEDAGAGGTICLTATMVM